MLAGQALLWLGDTKAAQQELVLAQRDLQDVPVVTAGIIPRRSQVEPWVESLRGELLLRAGKTDEARAVLQGVQSALRAIPGPDAWAQTLFRLELMARSAMELGDWTLAEHTAKQMLDHDPAYGGSHLAMAQVYQHKGKQADASREFETARRYWHDADRDLPELAQIAHTSTPRK